MDVFGREDSYYKSSLKLESLEYIFGWKLNGSIQWLIHILSIFQGEYYNQDEVQAMVAAEVLAEEKNKKYDEEQMRDDVPQDLTKSISEEAASKKRKRKRPLVAAWYAPTWHPIQQCFWNTYTNLVIILGGRKYTQIKCKFDIRILFQTSGLLSIGCQDVGGQLSRWNCHDGTWSTQCDHWDNNVL